MFTSRIAEREGPWPCGPGESLALRARLPPDSLGIAMTRPVRRVDLVYRSARPCLVGRTLSVVRCARGHVDPLPAEGSTPSSVN